MEPSMKFLTVAATLLCAVTVLAAEQPRAIIPVAGSTAGAHDSHFKTELQLNNRSLQTMKGMIVFHPLGRSAAPNDPSQAYELAPHQTLQYADIVATLGQSGLGSIDIVPEGMGVPTVVARAFNDNGDAGTTGATISALRSEDAVVVGETAILIVPADRQRFRFNVGVRTLDAGATALVHIYNESGVERKSFTVTYGPNYFVQQAGDAFTADTLMANETLAFEVQSGSLLVYGTTTDNATNDPSIQIAQRPLTLEE
jgi:hypothetical protein